MIRMEGPSFCFNSYDIGLPHYRMWKSIVGPDAMTPSQLAMEIFSTNLWSLQTFKSSFQNIILNTHGFDGGLWIGGIWDFDHKYRKAMHTNDLAVFGMLKPYNVGTIWIVSCKIAESEKGQSFCQTLANVAGTQVIASDTSQEVTTWQGIELASVWFYNYIDDFEGTVYSFTPAGGMRKGIEPERDVWTVRESRW